MGLIYTAGGVVSALVVALLLRFGRAPSKHRLHSNSNRTSSYKPVAGSLYRAVSIEHDQNACNAAREQAGKRFLVGKTPILPLADCDKSRCTCRYAHYEDRREIIGDRRDIKNDIDPEIEHRNASARRRTDVRRL